MNIISCDNCGVVIDADKLDFPYNLYKENGEINDENAAYDGDKYVAKMSCPVCQSDILEP